VIAVSVVISTTAGTIAAIFQAFQEMLHVALGSVVTSVAMLFGIIGAIHCHRGRRLRICLRNRQCDNARLFLHRIRETLQATEAGDRLGLLQTYPKGGVAYGCLAASVMLYFGLTLLSSRFFRGLLRSVSTP